MDLLPLFLFIFRQRFIRPALIVIEGLPLFYADVLLHDLVLGIPGLFIGELFRDLSRVQPEGLGQRVYRGSDEIIVGINDLAVKNHIVCLFRSSQDRPVPVKDVPPLISQNFR